MKTEDLKEMIAYTKNWKKWLESIYVKDEDKKNKERFIREMDDAIKKWELELKDSVKPI